MTRGRGKALAFPASAIALSIAVIGVAAGQDGSAADKVISAIDLAKPFGALAGWRFIAVQGPDEVNGLGETIPGKITLCLRPGIGAVCAPSLQSMARPPSPDYEISWRAHYLNDARVVYPRGRSAQPLLLLQTASSYSGDGDQVRYTQLLAYRREGDRFETIFARDTGRNNNQEVRFIDSGRLTGDVIVVEPTSNAPFAYWVTVNRLDPNYSYRQKLRYRSATRYGDNNPLTVIDSEMPNIQQRLGPMASRSADAVARERLFETPFGQNGIVVFLTRETTGGGGKGRTRVDEIAQFAYLHVCQ